MKSVLITGGTGAIGSKLVKALKGKNYHVSLVTRDVGKAMANAKPAHLSPNEYIDIKYILSPEYATNVVSNTDYIINLAGAGIADKPWSAEYKQEIINSRIIITQALANAISRAEKKPLAFISASAVGYYGSRGDEILPETASNGTGFLAEVCSQWEAAAEIAGDSTRLVNGRIGIVLDKKTGALPKMLAPFKFFSGSVLGSGKQWMPWIHITDLVNLFCYCIDNQNLRGPVNLTAPNPVTNKVFTKAIGRVVEKPVILKAPSLALKIMLGESADMVLGSQRAIPNAATEAGFEYIFADVGTALENLIG